MQGTTKKLRMHDYAHMMEFVETPTITATRTTTKTASKASLNLDQVTFVAIVGDRHTAKSNLLFKYFNEYKGERKCYFMGYPRAVEGAGVISNLSDLYMMRDAIVFMDEMQKYFKLYDRRANTELMEFLAVALHNKITLVATTPMTQFITKGVEASVDVWNMTRIRDLGSIKNGSKPKRIIQMTTHPACTKYALALENGQYLQYGDGLGPEFNGVLRFDNQGVGKEW